MDLLEFKTVVGNRWFTEEPQKNEKRGKTPKREEKAERQEKYNDDLFFS